MLWVYWFVNSVVSFRCFICVLIAAMLVFWGCLWRVCFAVSRHDVCALMVCLCLICKWFAFVGWVTVASLFGLCYYLLGIVGGLPVVCVV